ncbi:MAG: Eco57I restriction-modification methylase domain-containing protein, partial [bacterium]
MREGGFDVVIGNPPWVQSKYMDIYIKRYYEDVYYSAKKQYDIFNCFIEKSFKLLKNGGLFGYIIPIRFIMNPDYVLLREFLLKNVCIVELDDLGEHLFEGVEMPAILLFFKKPINKKDIDINEIEIKTDIRNLVLGVLNSYKILQNRFI